MGSRVISKSVALVLTGIGAAAVFFSGYETRASSHAIDDVAAYVRHRPTVLIEAARSEPMGTTLVVGDSIAERSGLHELCGRPVFNAGVSSAKLRDVHALAVNLVKTIKPGKVFIAIGTNDARSQDPTSLKNWAAEYKTLISEIGTVNTVLVPVPFIEPKKVASSIFNEVNAERLNSLLPQIAQGTRAKVAERPIFATEDGVHPTAVGASQWRAGLEKSCLPPIA